MNFQVTEFRGRPVDEYRRRRYMDHSYEASVGESRLRPIFCAIDADSRPSRHEST